MPVNWIIPKKSFFFIAAAGLILSSIGASLVPMAEANALRTTAEFTYNSAESIQGVNILYVNNDASNSNYSVEFKGTWPNYKTDKVTWAACTEAKGTACANFPVDCSGVITLVITSSDGSQGKVDANESGLGETTADSVDCKAAIAENSTITLKNPYNTTKINRANDRKSREATMTTYCQNYIQEIGAPPSALSGCVASMTAVFNSCYDQIGGGNGGTDNEVTIDALATCIDLGSNATKEKVAAALSGAAISSVKPGTVTNSAAPGTSATTCAIDGIGWILCPVMRFMGKVTDTAYGIVSDMLTVNPVDTSTSSPMYQAWSVMRNLANVAFVIAFLFIIFSQVTSVGITNYGIKKLLPKIIMAAILVNISYWLCAVAVDVSNIIGSSLKGVIEGAGNQIFVASDGFDSGTDGTWDVLVVTVLAGAAGVAVMFLGITILLPLLITAALTIITVVLVLTLRQALIILLIVVSPLAFVAYLLPNTESLFKKWLGLFKTLLLMFPIIAVVFGACKLASIIITGAAGDNIVLSTMAVGVTIIPLIVLPKLMSLAGSVGAKFGAMINNPNKGPFDRMRKGAEGLRKDRQNVRNTRALNGDKRAFGRRAIVQYGARRDAIRSGREAELKRANTGYVANEARNNPKFQNAIAGGTNLTGASSAATQRALASAIQVQASIEAEEVKAASAVIKDLNLDAAQMRTLAEGGNAAGLSGGSYAVRSAAMKNVVDTHDVEGVNSLLDKASGMDQKTRESLADSLQGSSEKPGYVGQGAIADLRQKSGVFSGAPGTNDLDSTGREISASEQLTVNAINNNTYSVDKLATGDKTELEHVAKVASNSDITTDNTQIAANAVTAQTDPRYSGRIGKNKDIVNDISLL